MKLSTLSRTTLLASGLAAFPQGGDLDQIVEVAKATWPGRHTVGIVCQWKSSGDTVRAMLKAFPPGSVVRVCDLRAGADIDKAFGILMNSTPTYLLLLPKDPVVHDGSWVASKMIRRMNHAEIPTLATTPAALRQGAWAVMGPATGNLLQVNPALNGYIEVYGTPIAPLRPTARYPEWAAPATLTVTAAF